MTDEDLTTTELRIDQARRERAEREQAVEAATEEGGEQHQRRAERAAYLRQRLEEREAAEGEPAAPEDPEREDNG